MNNTSFKDLQKYPKYDNKGRMVRRSIVAIPEAISSVKKYSKQNDDDSVSVSS